MHILKREVRFSRVDSMFERIGKTLTALCVLASIAIAATMALSRSVTCGVSAPLDCLMEAVDASAPAGTEEVPSRETFGTFSVEYDVTGFEIKDLETGQIIRDVKLSVDEEGVPQPMNVYRGACEGGPDCLIWYHDLDDDVPFQCYEQLKPNWIVTYRKAGTIVDCLAEPDLCR